MFALGAVVRLVTYPILVGLQMIFTCNFFTLHLQEEQARHASLTHEKQFQIPRMMSREQFASH